MVSSLFTLVFFVSTVAGSSDIVGGIKEIDKADLQYYSDLQKGLAVAAEVAKQKLNNESGIASVKSVVFVDPETIRASVQVVQGTLYRVTAKADVWVTVNGPEKPTNCEEQLSKTCSFKIWSRVWLPPPKKLIIEDLECL